MKKQYSDARCEGLICFVLGLITFAVFAPSLTHDFLGYDDQQYVTENPHVQAGLKWRGVVWAIQSFYASNWHPLTWLSHMVDCQFYALQPGGHHLTNVLWHVANTILLFVVLKRMTGAIWSSAFVAALFGWHPLHVESVAWVAERKDVLSTFFFLLTIWAYAAYANSKVRSQKTACILHSRFSFLYILALFFFVLGLMSKPMVVTLPFVLMLLDYWPLHRFQLPITDRQSIFRLLLEKAPFFVLSAGCCILTILAQRQGHAIVSAGGLPFSQRIPHVLVSCVHYLWAMFVPRHLAAYYPYPASTSGLETAGALLLLVLISFLALRSSKRLPYLLVGWLWYLGTLVPVIGLVQVGDQAWADRYSYLPLIGLFIAIVWGLVDAAEAAPDPYRRGTVINKILYAVPVVVGLALLAGTTHQLRYWKNTRVLFEHAAQVTANNGRALTVLGSLLAREGKLEEAKGLYLQALRYKPHDPEAHFFLGAALEQEGKLDEAIGEYTQALWFKPLQERTHIALGVALAKQKNYAAAAGHYQAALGIDPESATAHNNLARIFHTQGRLDEAIEHYAAALKTDPKLAQAHNNLGVLLLQKGRQAEGTAQLKDALRLNPGDPETEYNLAMALNQQRQWSEAAELFSRIAGAKPQDANLHYQFGLALAHLHRTREAMSRYAHAILEQPDFPEALDQLAWILSTDPRPEFRNGTEAVRMAERACELTGKNQAQMLKTLAAAYAEAGRLEDAVATAQRAQELAATTGQKELSVDCQRVLAGLKSGTPWRETAQATAQ